MIRLVVRHGSLGGTTFESIDDRILIGRDERNDLILNDPCVSIHHAQIGRVANRYVVMDCDSTNGTHLLRERRRIVLQPLKLTTLADGDIIDVGGVSLQITLTPTLDIKELLADWRAWAEVHGNAHRRVALGYIEKAAEHTRAHAEYENIGQALELLSAGVKTRKEWVAALEGLSTRLDALRKNAPGLIDADDLTCAAHERSESLREEVSASVKKDGYRGPNLPINEKLMGMLGARMAGRYPELRAAEQTRLSARRQEADAPATEGMDWAMALRILPSKYMVSFGMHLHDLQDALTHEDTAT
ncbi:FHA domain-containing protein [Pendulispora albinea]|uniref:FHA domain-containing protein n=1 Tax=Pendulispora albinea TaxID=2741071 RepID=A0ABZ2MCZ1_9BACT